MRIPVVPLLHFVSVASICGIGWAGYAAFSSSVDFRSEQKRIAKQDRALKKLARVATPGRRRWNYTGKDVQWFWVQFAEANFTGAIEDPPRPPAGGDDDETTAVDLTKLIELACIMHAGDNTGVVVRYLGDVEVPKSMKPNPARFHRIPRGRRPGLVLTPPKPTHHLQVGQTLWAPYTYAVLTRVDPDASSVTFQIRIETERVKGKYRTQRVHKVNLASAGFEGSGPDVHWSQRATSGRPTRAPGTDEPEDWQDMPAPALRRGRYEITPRHLDYLEAKALEHVALRSYRRSGVTGVEFQKLSSQAKRFGFEDGDVLRSVNGIPVKSLASLRRIGIRLYNRGVRTMRIIVLRRGRDVTLVFVLK